MAVKEFKKDKLTVRVYDTRKEMGDAAGHDAAEIIRKLLKTEEEVNIIFAAAPSQNETLAALLKEDDIDWSRINAFHMDEYIGLPDEAPQRFGNFLKDRIFGKRDFKSVNYINGNAKDIKTECERYSELLKKYPVHLVCLGIGENAHIAFNDPGVADFNDTCLIKTAKLDKVCRHQQVNDGCFEKIDDVPTHALTLTIPALCAAKYMICSVPAATKAQAVYDTVNAPISDNVPATAMRMHRSAVMYCDNDSGKMIL